MDFSQILPSGTGIVSGNVEIWTNSASPVLQTGAFKIGPVQIEGRIVYATLTGGIEGQDFQVRFTATDSDGHTWPRTALLLCSQTS